MGLPVRLIATYFGEYVSLMRKMPRRKRLAGQLLTGLDYSAGLKPLIEAPL